MKPINTGQGQQRILTVSDVGVGPRVLWLYRLMVFLILDLIVLGAAVRAFNAGLACPDWPLCFGDVIPDYHPQVYFEFIHRALAGSIALLFMGLTIYLWTQPQVSSRIKELGILALVLLLAQIIMGGLTVLKLLHAGVVTGHLILGLGFLAICSWILWDLQQSEIALGLSEKSKRTSISAPSWARYSIAGVLTLVIGQIVLGGLVASNYAGNVCVGFPLCNGQWVPTWAGPLGLQVIHRFGAYTVTLMVLAMTWAFHRHRAQIPVAMVKLSRRLSYLVLAQVLVGIVNVLLFTPALITILHSGLAAYLLLTSLRLLRETLVVEPRQVLDQKRKPGRLESSVPGAQGSLAKI